MASGVKGDLAMAMTKKTKQRGAVSAAGIVGLGIIGFLALSGLVVIGEEVDRAAGGELGVDHSECLLFTPAGGQFRMNLRDRFPSSTLTQQVDAKLARSNAPTKSYVIAGGSRTEVFQDTGSTNIIDREIFGALKAAGVTPAARTTDLEFIRRATLDLTGRIPKPARISVFLNDPSPDKRAALVDELLASPEYVDKWTMFFGDLFKNSTRTTQVLRFAEGRDAFRNWIKDAVATNKPYSQMATELISSQGTNSYLSGELNWMIGGFVTGSPAGRQDIFDQQAANVAETFLGISHENCILCHDGRRHLDALSVWGKQETRYKSWQLAAFFGKTNMTRNFVTPGNNNVYYWTVADNPRAVDYPLNTTTGNRPARARIGTIANVTPEYPFTGEKPVANENYRVALARFLTNDPQFSRAAVNLLWKQLFGRGIIDPVNQVDPLRLDASTLPPVNPDAPRLSTLQPSNPALLEGLAKEFQAEGFKIKDTLRKMVLSDAYQLSSRYEGTWKPEYEPLFARKFVRRLWGEEIVDSLIQASNLPLTMLVGTEPISWAMQLPEPVNLPRGGTTSSFLDSFLRGNRDNEDRRGDGNIAQVLNLMNDTLVTARAQASGTGATASLARQLLDRYPQAAANSALIQDMFLTVLSRPATATELDLSMKKLGTLTGNARVQSVEDVLWSLFNKVDFLYNY
jgi:Protein of unknown function (DUF1549)/Protein of unknown function (DUF1553)